MREKDKRISVKFTEEEHEKLKEFSAKCGLNQSQLLRLLIKDYVPKPQPSKVYWQMMNELFNVHSAFKLLTESGFDCTPGPCEIMREIEELALLLQQVLLPERRNVDGNHKSLVG